MQFSTKTVQPLTPGEWNLGPADEGEEEEEEVEGAFARQPTDRARKISDMNPSSRWKGWEMTKLVISDYPVFRERTAREKCHWLPPQQNRRAYPDSARVIML